MDKNQIKFVITQHNNAIANIKELETTCNVISITDDKSKANFGNFCVLLRGFRMIADATEAILINDNILKGDDGFFYQKIDNEPETNEEEDNDEIENPNKKEK